MAGSDYTILRHSSTIYHVTLYDHRARKSGVVSSEDWPHYKIRGCDALYFVSFTFARYFENLRFRPNINAFYIFVIKVPVVFISAQCGNSSQ